MVPDSDLIERTLDNFGRATDANWHTPGRAGSLVVLTSQLGSEVMVTGDLHGNRGNFEQIVQTAGLDRNPRRHLVLQEVCHGGPTYPETGGCMSHALLEDVARLKATYPDRVHLLLGNHELAEMVDYPIQKNRRVLNLAFRIGMQQTYGMATERIRESFCRFLESCPLAVSLPGGVFVSHTIPEEVDTRGFDVSLLHRSLQSQDYAWQSVLFDLVWGRDYRPANARAFADLVGAKVLIQGHDPCRHGFKVPNDVQVILDCCSTPANYLVLPLDRDRDWTHAEVVAQIRPLR